MRFKISYSLTFFTVLICLCGYGQDSNYFSIKKNPAIDSILVKKVAYNLTHPSMGYSIQIYYGSENLAYKFKDDFEMAFPEQTANISFATPDWKVMIGKFRTRIEADHAILPIKQNFKEAIVVLMPFSFD